MPLNPTGGSIKHTSNLTSEYTGRGRASSLAGFDQKPTGLGLNNAAGGGGGSGGGSVSRGDSISGASGSGAVTGRPSIDQFANSKSKARMMFDKYDTDGSGNISVLEFRKLCYDMGYFLSDKELALDVQILDVDGDGEISYEEFIKWWKDDNRFKSLQMSSDDYDILAKYLQNFKKFDKDGSGIIDVREFKALYVDLVKKKMTSTSLMGTFQDLDVNKDGKVSFNEYVGWALKCTQMKKEKDKEKAEKRERKEREKSVNEESVEST